MAELGGPGLNATEFFYPRTVTWSSGVNVAVVEVDRETGLIKVLKYVFIHDCGLPMNPMIVDGQISGGFAQGFAAAVAEQLVHDKQGQVLTGSLMDYYVPRAGDIPEVEMDHVVFPTKDNPLGIKSVGESGPNSPPAAMAAAIEDALEAPLRSQGCRSRRASFLEPCGCDEAARFNTGQRRQNRERGRASASAGTLYSRSVAPYRHACRLRHDAMRLLYGADERAVGEVMHDLCGAGRRSPDRDRGKPCKQERIAPDPAGLQGKSRPAMWLLHAPA